MLSHRAVSSKLPSAWPSNSPLEVKRYCIISAQLLPHSSSAQRAARAILKSPGGSELNSLLNLPLDPPLSATVTIAVNSFVIFLKADKVAARPWPPPSATTLGLLNAPYLNLYESREPKRYVLHQLRCH